MQVYDKVIETTRELLQPFLIKERNRNHAKPWNLLKKDKFVLQKEVAFELGSRWQSSTCYQALTSSKELLPEDKILLYEQDLPEIKKNVPFARITWVQIDLIEDQDKAYQKIEKLEFAKFKIIPEEHDAFIQYGSKRTGSGEQKSNQKQAGFCDSWVIC